MATRPGRKRFSGVSWISSTILLLSLLAGSNAAPETESDSLQLSSVFKKADTVSQASEKVQSTSSKDELPDRKPIFNAPPYSGGIPHIPLSHVSGTSEKDDSSNVGLKIPAGSSGDGRFQPQTSQSDPETGAEVQLGHHFLAAAEKSSNDSQSTSRQGRAIVRPLSQLPFYYGGIPFGSQLMGPAAAYQGVEGRQFFNPFNHIINPLAQIWNPTAVLNANANQLVLLNSQLPRVAIATLSNSADTTTVGYVLFLQKNAESKMVVIARGQATTSTLTATTTGVLEIRAGVGTGAGRCTTAATTAATPGMGDIYNPNGVTDGGVISTAVTVRADAAAGTDVLTAYVENVPPTRLSFWEPSSLTGKGVRYATTSGGTTDVYCGAIREA